MQNDSMIQQFQNNEFGAMETLQIGDKFYFPAIECAVILGYDKPHNAIKRHCDDSLKRGVVTKTTNQHGFTSEQTPHSMRS